MGGYVPISIIGKFTRLFSPERGTDNRNKSRGFDLPVQILFCGDRYAGV
jgi:hypothetical protein